MCDQYMESLNEKIKAVEKHAILRNLQMQHLFVVHK